MSLTKQIVDVLVAFVMSAFVNNDDDKNEPFRDKALSQLKALFEKWEFSVVPSETPTKGKGNKAVAHNTFDNKYLRVSRKGVECATILKPVFATKPNRFLGFVVVPDSDRVNSLEQLESFALCYQAKEIKKHEDFVSMSVGCTARQQGEDIRNNAAQKWLRKEAQAENLNKIAIPFLNIPDAMWETVKPSLLLGMGEETVSFIEEMRAELVQV